MRLLIALGVCVAVSSARHFHDAAPFKYTGPLNMETRLVDHPNGAKVPADEPAVATARAAHLSSKAAVASVGAAASFTAGNYKSSGAFNLDTRLVDFPNGAKVPAEEPAVAAARAAHLSSKAATAASVPVAASAPFAASDFKYTGPLNLNTRLVDHPNGAKVPADEPAVATARAAHLSSKAAIAASAPVGAAAPFAAAPVAGAPFKYTGPLNLNTRLVDHPNGAKVPADEPVVAAARAAHLSVKASTAASATVGAAVPFAAASFKYTGPLNLETRLVDHPNGAKVPADEPAVAAARAAHIRSKAATAVSSPVGATSGYKSTGAFNLDTRLVDFPNGAVVPAYEPVVAAARSSHLKAKAAVSTASIGPAY